MLVSGERERDGKSAALPKVALDLDAAPVHFHQFAGQGQPQARALKLTFRGTSEEIPVDIRLEPAARSQLE